MFKSSFYETVVFTLYEPTGVMCINRACGVFVVFLLMVHSLLRVWFLVCFGHRLSDIWERGVGGRKLVC